MVQLIVGNKGKGKTRCLLDKVNSDVKSILGSICYLDKSTKHMFELNNRVRLICVPDYQITDTDMFLGFVAGIISQDRDLEQMYFDSFLTIACLEGKDITEPVKKLQELSELFHLDFIISIALDEAEIPEELRQYITISL
ncbi:MAG: twitching motility protein PilT [Eubacterium sp.]|nr:twitching motility protein PilT [Eubacterium sp.]MBQ9642575.1 twitching motility protein PilT [Lachnospiraceae bacterium]